VLVHLPTQTNTHTHYCCIDSVCHRDMHYFPLSRIIKVTVSWGVKMRRWRQQVPPKCSYFSTKLCGITSQKNLLLTLP